MTDASTADLWANLGVLLAAAVAALVGYFGPKVLGKSPPPAANTCAIVAGVRVELGNRQQIDQLIAAVNRVADVIEGKKQSAMEEMIRRMSEELDEMREEQRWQRPP